MNRLIGLKNMALAVAGCLILAAQAQTQSASEFKNIEIAQEALAFSVTLPSGKSDALVMAPCGGCPVKTFRITRSTEYFLGERPVELPELKAALNTHPKTILTVSYIVETGEVTRISSATDFRSPAKNR